MLIRLLDNQIAEYWNDIRFAIGQSLPPTLKGEGARMDKVLESLLMGSAQCWVSVDKDSKQMDALITTAVVEDMLTGSKSLMLYTVYAYRPTVFKSWKEGFETLSKFAKSEGCNRILGFTKEPRMIEHARKFGANVDFVLGIVEV